MIEKDFVTALMETINKRWPEAFVWRPNDGMTLGIPDVIAFMPPGLGYVVPWTLAIEAKQVRPLLQDPWDPGRRKGPLLKHPFTGPQASTLRAMKRVGVNACGLVRVTSDAAVQIQPHNIPADTGNFTHEELMRAGTLVRRESGIWHFV